MPLRSLSSLATTSNNYCYILFANTCQSRPNLMMDYLSATSKRLNLIRDDRRKPCCGGSVAKCLFLFVVGLREDEYRILSAAHTSRGSEFIAVMRFWSGTGLHGVTILWLSHIRKNLNQAQPHFSSFVISNRRSSFSLFSFFFRHLRRWELISVSYRP